MSTNKTTNISIFTKILLYTLAIGMLLCSTAFGASKSVNVVTSGSKASSSCSSVASNLCTALGIASGTRIVTPESQIRKYIGISGDTKFTFNTDEGKQTIKIFNQGVYPRGGEACHKFSGGIALQLNGTKSVRNAVMNNPLDYFDLYPYKNPMRNKLKWPYKKNGKWVGNTAKYGRPTNATWENQTTGRVGRDAGIAGTDLSFLGVKSVLDYYNCRTKRVETWGNSTDLKNKIKSELYAGRQIIAYVLEVGYWSNSNDGHYVTLLGMTDKGHVLVADTSNKSRSCSRVRLETLDRVANAMVKKTSKDKEVLNWTKAAKGYLVVW